MADGRDPEGDFSSLYPPISGLDTLFEKIVRFAARREAVFHAAIRRWTDEREARPAVIEDNGKQCFNYSEPLFPFVKTYFSHDEKFVLVAAFHDAQPHANKKLCPWDLDKPVFLEVETTEDRLAAGIAPWVLDEPERMPYVVVVRSIATALSSRDIPVFERLLADCETEATSREKATVHGIDFRSLKWFGTNFAFTANQATVIRILYEHWEQGTPDVSDETVLMAVDHTAPPARLNVVFRDHEAWGTLIVPGSTKGTHRLQEPSQKKTD